MYCIFELDIVVFLLHFEGQLLAQRKELSPVNGQNDDMNDLLNRKMISVLKGLELFVQHNTELGCTAADKYHVMHDNLISRELSILKAKRDAL